jgi:hypothetical protein
MNQGPNGVPIQEGVPRLSVVHFLIALVVLLVAIPSAARRIESATPSYTSRRTDYGTWNSVRDAPFAPPTNYEHPRGLEWIISNWANEMDKGEVVAGKVIAPTVQATRTSWRKQWRPNHERPLRSLATTLLPRHRHPAFRIFPIAPP